MRWYEIGFDGDVAEDLRRITPNAQVTDLPASTILWSSHRTPTDLDTLLDTLLALGLTPQEVHESADGRTYSEVRLNGSLGEGLLGYLGWSHRVCRTTVVRLRTSHDELRAVLLQIAALTRLDYVLAL